MQLVERAALSGRHRSRDAGSRDLSIETDIYLNQLAQGVHPVADGLAWFLAKPDNEQVALLNLLSNFITQQHPDSNAMVEAVNLSQLKPTITPCQLLMKAAAESTRTYSKLSSALGVIVHLPSFERKRSFVLLISLLSVSIRNRRLRERIPERLWWLRDLSDADTVWDIVLECKWPRDTN